ncbi:MFS transporter [Phenylobacterium sp.]|uniref:MFS transporter n=1 Tax=Phenylobacterium sp. TaxID=1871053 RepID=UPI0025DA7540|nr:MFS transporter [Phenylobacterium sp.]
MAEISETREAAAPGLTSAPGAQARTGAYAWYVVAFLTVAATLSSVDRQVLAVLIGPIQRDLDLSNSQMGLLGGVAFSLLYSVGTVPAAWIADKRSRRIVITGGIAFWSAMTAACGMVGQFATLFLTRMGVGLGEAALGPAAYSMMSDLLPRRKLPMAIGLFTAAPFFGVGVASIGGGQLAQYFETAPPLVLPLLGAVRSWQAIFLLLGLLGVMMALVGFATLREPARKGRATEDGQAPMTSRQVLTFLGERRRFLTLHFTAYIAMSVQGWGLFFWVIEFLVRERGLPRAEAGLKYGLMAFGLGLAGSIVSGRLASRLVARGSADATMRLVLFCILALMPLAIAMPLVPLAWQTLLLLLPITFLMGWPGALGMTALQFIVPNELKGRIIALYSLVVNAISLALGPLLGGLISDKVFGGTSLGGSLSLMAAINYPLAAIALLLCLGPFRAALDKARAWEAK